MTGARNERWPADLRIFGAIFALWALSLILRVFTRSGIGDAGDPTQAVVLGYKLYGLMARFALLGQSAVYAFFGIGMLAQRRWALVLALLYFGQVVVSLLVFILLYLHVPGQEIHVKYSAFGGPVIVLFLLYLWIRSRDLICSSGAATSASPGASV